MSEFIYISLHVVFDSLIGSISQLHSFTITVRIFNVIGGFGNNINILVRDFWKKVDSQSGFGTNYSDSPNQQQGLSTGQDSWVIS
jgi:hypothetical protein